MDEQIRIALIYGSTRKGRFCDKVAGWAAEQIRASGNYTVDVIDPAVVLPGQRSDGQQGSAETDMNLNAEIYSYARTR